jgi:hypothetical protein
MNSVFLLIHYREFEDIEVISAHPTKEAAKSAERFFRQYNDKFQKGDNTDILEVPFET